MKKTIFCIMVLLSLTGCEYIQPEENLNTDINSSNEKNIVEESSISIPNDISNKEYMKFNAQTDDWLEHTKKDEYVITVIGASYCGHCISFKPVIEKVSNKYNINSFYYYINQLDNTDSDIVSKTYETNYENTVPHMFITKNGNVITNITIEMNEEKLIEFLRLNLVIE